MKACTADKICTNSEYFVRSIYLPVCAFFVFCTCVFFVFCVGVSYLSYHQTVTATTLAAAAVIVPVGCTTYASLQDVPAVTSSCLLRASCHIYRLLSNAAMFWFGTRTLQTYIPASAPFFIYVFFFSLSLAHHMLCMYNLSVKQTCSRSFLFFAF